MVPSKIIQEIRGMMRNQPREICGLISSEHKLYPIKNVSSYQGAFIFDKRQYHEALSRISMSEEEVLCVYHSHPETPEPSRADLESVRRTKYNYLIVSPNDYRWIDYAACS